MKALIFPRDKNPYQEFLYAPMRKSHKDLRITYVNSYPFIGATFFPVAILFRRLQGYKLIHVHWPAFTLSLPFFPFNKRASYYLFKFCVGWSKLLGYKIIWTVHNVIPHEPQTSDDLRLMRAFSHTTDFKIIHSESAIAQMKQSDLDVGKYSVVPVGSYGNLYPDIITKQKARKILRLANDEFVILFFGLIRPYKGVEDLIDVLEKLKLPNVRLVIAGKCVDSALPDRVKVASEHIAIDFYNNFIPNSEVAQYFKASDIVCLPFRKVTTSSSALLAMAFSKPVVAPQIGALKDLPEKVGYLYNPKQKNALEKALHQAISDKSNLKKLGKNAQAYAATLSWDKIAEQTYEIYEGVLSEPAKDKS